MKNPVAVLMVATVLAQVTAACAEPFDLKTRTGNDIGLSLSSYQYQEPGYMSLKGLKMGLDMHVVRVSEDDDNLIFRGDLRYAFGTVDYTSNGSGSASGEPDWYIEARALAGKDWVVNDAVISPYLGLGYRYLFNDGRGITSTGYGGYRRESNYIYLPVGIIQRMTFNDQARLVSTLEYDQLLVGKQISHLSDTGLYQDVTNNQNSGYGLKLSAMYQQGKWTIGPYANYWNISQSDTALLYYLDGSLYGTGTEPNNNTLEFGVKASQQF